MRQNVRGHVRQRENGKWEGQYYYLGKKRSIYGLNEVETRLQLKHILQSIKDGTYLKPSGHTVKSWLEEWLDKYTLSNRPTTVEGYRKNIENHINPSIGPMRLTTVSVDVLQSLFNRKMYEGRSDKKEGGLSAKTLKNIKYVLNMAFSQACYNKLIYFNPVEGVKLPVPEQNEQRVLSDNENELLLQTAISSDKQVAKAIIILLTCGLRKGELLGLRRENVDFENNYITIKNSIMRLYKFDTSIYTSNFIQIDTYAPKRNKTAIYLGPVKTKRANRKIYLPQSARKALEDLIEMEEINKQRSRKRSFNPYGFLFCTKEGTILDPRNFEEKYKSFIAEAQIDKTNIHATRHTFATQALSKTSDILAVSEILGHAAPSTTLNMYGHTFEERKKKVMTQFDK